MTIHSLSASQQDRMRQTGVWKPGCPVSLDRLRTVDFMMHTFSGTDKKGSLVVLDAVAPFVQTIMDELYAKKVPFERADPIEEFDADDDASMVANNCSAFNYRLITHTTSLSIHSYGVAIDLNPVQNPFIRADRAIDDPQNRKCKWVEVWPSQGTAFLNRTNIRPGMLEPYRDLFFENGFRVWGGRWDDMPDYHHIQPPRAFAELLAACDPATATQLFATYVAKGWIDVPENWREQI